MRILTFCTFCIFLLAIFASASYAEQSIPLLAVEEGVNNTIKGSTASLSLKLIEGNGNVYLDTFPLTKLDTQMSLRFARDVACELTKKDCSKFDFLYTLRADSPIVGGPSAGAASTVLTIAELEGYKIGDNKSITGTINSGGFIGNVGGIKEKIDAASKNGIKTVVIPKGSLPENKTINKTFTEY